jgi:hypothetical protein
MPVTIKQQPPAEPPRIAETPEFKELQAQIEQATSLLASISNQIVAIEAKMKPNTNKGAYLPSAPSTSVEEAKYQESIAEMRRIAGLR